MYHRGNVSYGGKKSSKEMRKVNNSDNDNDKWALLLMGRSIRSENA